MTLICSSTTGIRTHLHPVERTPLWRCIGHPEMLANALANCFTDGLGIFNEPLCRFLIVMEVHLNVDRRGFGRCPQ